jgi:hypothetical protein
MAALSLSPCGRGCLSEAKAGEGFLSAVTDPSTGSNLAELVLGRREAPIRVLILATFSHKGRREENRR